MKSNSMMFVVCVLLIITASASWAQAAADRPSPAAAAGKPANAGEWQNRWFMFYGASNLHGNVRESERLINRQINDTVGRVVPGWRRPATFREWSDNFMMWDFHAGIGRDINPKLSWFTAATATYGSVNNGERYQLLFVPFRAHMDFSRRVLALQGGITYYPFGKPALLAEGAHNRFLRSLLGTRPFVEAAVCYVRLKAVADTHFTIPGITTLLSIYQKTDYDLFYGSPRIGIETPINDNNSIALEAGYLFFTCHPTEFDNFSVYLFHRHKF